VGQVHATTKAYLMYSGAAGRQTDATTNNWDFRLDRTVQDSKFAYRSMSFLFNSKEE
jgi:hypothetical protein